MLSRGNLNRPLLYALIDAVVIGALYRFVFVPNDQAFRYDDNVLVTALIIAIASLSGLACDLARVPWGLNILPSGGIVLTQISAVMLLVVIWNGRMTDSFTSAALVVTNFALATVHICLLSVIRLARRFSWVYFVACQVDLGLAILISVIFVWDIKEDRAYDVVMALVIVVAVLSAIFPILHRISKRTDEDAGFSTPLELRNAAVVDREIEKLERQIAALRRLSPKASASPPSQDASETDAAPDPR